MSLITFSDKGLYCPRADVYIDPWKPVRKALITHAHADHSRYGMQQYLAHHDSIPVMRWRLGDIAAQGIAYNEKIVINGVEVSFHPAGHIPGSAQIRLAYKDEVWVISGDYKLEDDGLSTPFEAVKCSHFVTESTFGLPVYQWRPQQEIMTAVNTWWAANKEEGLCSVLLCYALGKAQRLLNGLDTSIGPVLLHGAIANTNVALESIGYKFPNAAYLSPDIKKELFRGAMVLAPPSALGSPWIKKLRPYKVATASGWMSLRGARRRRNVDTGFIFSDHADWEGLNTAVEETGADHVFVTHGYSTIFSKWLQSKGIKATAVQTEFEGELSEIGEGNKELTDQP